MLKLVKQLFTLPHEISMLANGITNTAEKTIASLKDNGSFQDNIVLDFIHDKIRH
jgi:hypothetical protein